MSQYKQKIPIEKKLIAMLKNSNSNFFTETIKQHSLSIWIFLVILIFLTGGGSRADIYSLPLLRGISAAMLPIMALALPRALLFEIRWPLIIIALCALTIILQLIPLPYSIWSALPGRELIVESFARTGMGTPAMPLTMAPFEAWNSLLSLVVPANMLLCTALVSRTGGRKQILVLLIIVGFCALLGLLQLLGSDRSLLYLYRITNNGAAVGLFANRNHTAALLACGFPFIAAWITQVSAAEHRAQAVKWIALLCGAALVPMIIVTGSRGGLVWGLIGLLFAAAIYHEPDHRFRVRKVHFSVAWKRIIQGALAVTLLISLSMLTGRWTAIDRLQTQSFGEEARIILIPTYLQMAENTFPIGAGAGGFVPMYKVFEGNRSLSPNYLNHAHNDLIEIVIEYGVLGIVFVMTLIGAWSIMTLRIARRWRAIRKSASRPNVSDSLGLAGSGVTLILLLASVADYPLRVPSLACLAMIAIVWMIRNGADESADKLPRR